MCLLIIKILTFLEGYTYKVNMCGYYCLSEDTLHMFHKHDLHSYLQLSENWRENYFTDLTIFVYLNFILLFDIPGQFLCLSLQMAAILVSLWQRFC